MLHFIQSLHKKCAPLDPVAALPMADKFNQVMCTDVKEHIHNKTGILHMTDSATRYSAACLVSFKRQEICAKIYQMSIVYFGAHRKFLCNNIGEFSNERYKEMNEKLNIETAMTAGESPFSNTIVEQHNQILAEAFYKTNCGKTTRLLLLSYDLYK